MCLNSIYESSILKGEGTLETKTYDTTKQLTELTESFGSPVSARCWSLESASALAFGLHCHCLTSFRVGDWQGCGGFSWCEVHADSVNGFATGRVHDL